MEERISGIEDIIEEMDTSVKENVKSKKFLTKHPGNLGHHKRSDLLEIEG